MLLRHSKRVSIPLLTYFKCAGMVNVIDRRCQEPNCKKFPSHNYPGMHKKLYCATHKKEGMVTRLLLRLRVKDCMHCIYLPSECERKLGTILVKVKLVARCSPSAWVCLV